MTASPEDAVCSALWKFYLFIPFKCEYICLLQTKQATKFYSTAAVMHYYDSIERSKKVLLATASQSSLCVLWRLVISAPQPLKLPAPAHSWVALRSAAAALPSSPHPPFLLYHPGPQSAIQHPSLYIRSSNYTTVSSYCSFYWINTRTVVLHSLQLVEAESQPSPIARLQQVFCFSCHKTNSILRISKAKKRVKLASNG